MAKKPNFEAQPNPALAFISRQEPQKAQTKGNTTKGDKKAPEAAPEAPEGYRLVPENKSQRLQLVLTPTLYRKVKAKATEKGQSVNGFITQLLTDAVKTK